MGMYLLKRKRWGVGEQASHMCTEAGKKKIVLSVCVCVFKRERDREILF